MSSFYSENPGLESETVKVFTYEDLKLYTNNFSEENFIGDFQWGKVYRGYYDAREVMVKKWAVPTAWYMYYRGENEGRLKVYLILIFIVWALFFFENCN